MILEVIIVILVAIGLVIIATSIFTRILEESEKNNRRTR
jgi:hypothetical protein